MSETLKLARLYFLLLSIFTVMRWILGTVADLPYDRGHHIFSIVILTILSALYYGAFVRRWLRKKVWAAILLGATLGLSSQTVILLATLLSYAIGAETYFNNSTAVNLTQHCQPAEVVPFLTALGARAGGLVANTLFTVIAGALGWAMGGLLPELRPEP